MNIMADFVAILGWLAGTKNIPAKPRTWAEGHYQWACEQCNDWYQVWSCHDRGWESLPLPLLHGSCPLEDQKVCWQDHIVHNHLVFLCLNCDSKLSMYFLMLLFVMFKHNCKLQNGPTTIFNFLKAIFVTRICSVNISKFKYGTL